MDMERPHRGERWIEACLLCLLKEEDSYGYQLQDQLNLLALQENPIHISLIYRALQGMENRGLVVSSWTGGGPGPKKRVYSLTPDGSYALDLWMVRMRARRDMLTAMIDKYDGLKE